MNMALNLIQLKSSIWNITYTNYTECIKIEMKPKPIANEMECIFNEHKTTITDQRFTN